MTAHDHGAVVDATDQPLPRGLGHLRRNWQCQPSLAGLLDDRLGNRVLGCLFERRRQPQHVVLSHAAICAGRHDLRPPIRQRPRLVEDQRARAGHRFKGSGPLDQHSVMSGAGKASHQRHGHSQDQRARRCHHQYGDSTDRVACYPPRREGDGDSDEQEGKRPSVGEPRHWRLRSLSLFDEANDAGIGAVACRSGRKEVECVASIGGTAHCLAALLHPDRQRLPRQGGGIQEGDGGSDGAIDRDHVPLPDQQPVAGCDGIERHVFQCAIDVPRGRPRHAREQVAHLATRAAFGEAFKKGTAGIHHRNNVGRERFPEQERGRHGKSRHDIEPDLTPAQAVQDLD